MPRMFSSGVQFRSVTLLMACSEAVRGPGVNKALTKKAQVSEAGESHVNALGFMEHTSQDVGVAR